MTKWLLVLIVGATIITLLVPWMARHGLGHLPGDVTFNWKGRRIYLPITTTILLSLALTLVGRLV
jgi:hypothetical protein